MSPSCSTTILFWLLFEVVRSCSLYSTKEGREQNRSLSDLIANYNLSPEDNDIDVPYSDWLGTDLHPDLEIDPQLLNSTPPVRSRVVWCHPTVHGDVSVFHKRNLEEWQMYHRALGFDRVYVFAGNVTSQAMRDFVRNHSGFFELHENKKAKSENDYFGQPYAVSRCFKMAKAAGYKWALFGDFDEFLWWRGPAKTVTEWLETIDTNVDCATLGKHFYTPLVMRPGLCGLAKFAYTPPIDYCFSQHGSIGPFGLCESWYGRRKMVVRLNNRSHSPRTHECRGGNHWTLSTSDAHLKEYRGYPYFLPYSMSYINESKANTHCTQALRLPTPLDGRLVEYAVSYENITHLVYDGSAAEFLKARLPAHQWAHYMKC